MNDNYCVISGTGSKKFRIPNCYAPDMHRVWSIYKCELMRHFPFLEYPITFSTIIRTAVDAVELISSFPSKFYFEICEHVLLSSLLQDNLRKHLSIQNRKSKPSTSVAFPELSKRNYICKIYVCNRRINMQCIAMGLLMRSEKPSFLCGHRSQDPGRKPFCNRYRRRWRL